MRIDIKGTEDYSKGSMCVFSNGMDVTSAEAALYKSLLSKRGCVTVKFMNEYGSWFASVDIPAHEFETVNGTSGMTFGTDDIVFVNKNAVIVAVLNEPCTVMYMGVFSDTGELYTISSIGINKLDAGYMIVIDPSALNIGFDSHRVICNPEGYHE